MLAVHADDIIFSMARGEVKRFQGELETRLKLKWGAELAGDWTIFLGLECRWQSTPGGTGKLECRAPLAFYDKLLATY